LTQEVIVITFGKKKLATVKQLPQDKNALSAGWKILLKLFKNKNYEYGTI
jgi:hypothetical protein